MTNLIPCTNCGTVNWAAKNDKHCTSCEHTFTAAAETATHQCRYSSKLHKAGPHNLALVLVNSNWIETKTPNRFLAASIFIKLEK